ncbi:hypothetical protein TNCV_4855161 [Trichonephila clavipes]|nr:hypothetical protein TNCV_4855161 [Trichonephila clavipes]
MIFPTSRQAEFSTIVPTSTQAEYLGFDEKYNLYTGYFIQQFQPLHRRNSHAEFKPLHRFLGNPGNEAIEKVQKSYDFLGIRDLGFWGKKL